MVVKKDVFRQAVRAFVLDMESHQNSRKTCSGLRTCHHHISVFYGGLIHGGSQDMI